MASLQSLSDELLLDILSYATEGLTFATAVGWQRVNRRFRDCIASIYIRYGRLLDQKVPRKRVSRAYGCRTTFPMDLATEVLRRSWRDATVVDSHFARCVEAFELRIHQLNPEVSSAEIHLKVCEFFARKINVHQVDGNFAVPGLSDYPTVREVYHTFTGWIAKRGIIKESDLVTLDLDSISHCTKAADTQKPRHLQQLDREAWTAAFTFGFADFNGAGSAIFKDLFAHELAAPTPYFDSPLGAGALMANAPLVRHALPLFMSADTARAQQLELVLRCASRNGHVKVVKAMLENEVVREQLAGRLRTGHAGLVHACRCNMRECAELLLPFVQDADESQIPPPSVPRLGAVYNDPQYCNRVFILTDILRQACESGANSEIAELLINNGAHVNGRPGLDNRYSWTLAERDLSLMSTPLSQAIHVGAIGLVKTLLRLGASTDVSYLTGAITDGPMLRHDDVEMLILLDDAGTDVAAVRSMMLVSAARVGAIKCVEYMLDNYPVRAWGDTPQLALYFAAALAKPDTLKLLLRRGGAEMSKVLEKNKALEHAVKKRRLGSMIALLDFGAKLEYEGRVEAAKTLLEESGMHQYVPMLTA